MALQCAGVFISLGDLGVKIEVFAALLKEWGLSSLFMYRSCLVVFVFKGISLD